MPISLPAHTDYPTPESGRSTQPDFLVPFRQNLGYSAQATLNIPLWNWGATHSKVKQASLKTRQAELDLTVARKQLEADLASSYQEAQSAFTQVESLRSSSDLAAESLRLTLLRIRPAKPRRWKWSMLKARPICRERLRRWLAALSGVAGRRTKSNGGFIVKPACLAGAGSAVAAIFGCSKSKEAGDSESAPASPVEVASAKRIAIQATSLGGSGSLSVAPSHRDA